MTEINSMVPWSIYRGMGDEEDEADAEEVDADMMVRGLWMFWVDGRRGA